jgi:protein-tyrosine-phosphatase
MAEALFNRLVPDDVRAESAGQEPRREGVWPAVVEVMREIGIDLASKRPKRLMPEMQLHADWTASASANSNANTYAGSDTQEASQPPARRWAPHRRPPPGTWAAARLQHFWECAQRWMVFIE